MVEIARANYPESLKEIHATLKQADWSNSQPWKVAVLRNITVEAIKPYWEYCAYQLGLRAELSFGDFDNVVQEALGASGDSALPDADCILIFLKLETLSTPLSAGFTSLDAKAKDQEIERILGLVRTVIEGVRAQSGGMILMHAFEPPEAPACGALDANLEDGQQGTIATLNEGIRAICRNVADAFIVNTPGILARLGTAHYYDRRYWHIGRAPYSAKALTALAAEHAKFVRARIGRQKKCLLLDCDNTLWGGIIGEDGLTGIKIGDDYPGSAYKAFQENIVALADRGIIIGLISKNNEADVWEVFDKFPDMPLQKEHIAGSRINWDDKATNIASLIQELNIGMDSVLFVDDSEFELNLVASALPDVDVVRFPDNPLDMSGWLLNCGLFDTLTLSTEDRERARMYREESTRTRHMESFVDLDDYYASLEMEIELRALRPEDVKRAAQLTQKTNQFNLTTVRHSETDVTEFIESDTRFAIQVQLRDRFGDYGVIGLALVIVQDDVAEIETFLLSCRALGRRVEHTLLREVMRYARERGASKVIGSYRPTKKNQQTASFYSDNNFAPADHDPQEFEYDLAAGVPAPAEIFKTISSELD